MLMKTHIFHLELDQQLHVINVKITVKPFKLAKNQTLKMTGNKYVVVLMIKPKFVNQEMIKNFVALNLKLFKIFSILTVLKLILICAEVCQILIINFQTIFQQLRFNKNFR